MSVNLAASQSAIAHDITSNTTHVVWANNGNIWHAVFDENSETWINAEPIAFAGTAPITGLNLVTSEKLIDGKNPGIAVVWQQGKLNSSDFYYTAAQYDQNLNLQWLPSSQALTSDQVGDLQPTVTVNNIGEVIVFGTKVNLVNAANWAISEDTDLYYQQFTVSSSQFTSTADDVAGQATYSPQLGQNGIVNMGVFANNTQTSVPSTQPSTGSAQVATLSTNSETSQSELQPIGSWNSQIYFSSNLLEDWELKESVPEDGFLRSIIEPFMKEWELTGIISGGTTFGGGEESIYLESNAEIQWKSPFLFRSPLTTVLYDEKKDSLYYGRKKSPIQFGFELETVYAFETTSPYDLIEIEDALAFTASLTLPLTAENPALNFFKADFVADLGLIVNLTASPESSDSDYSPETLKAYAASLVVGAGMESFVLAKALASGNEEAVVGLIAAELALNVAETVAAFITGAASGLDLSGSVSFPFLQASVEGTFQIPHLPILRAEITGGVETEFTWGIDPAPSTASLTFPLSLEARVGPLGFGFNFDPGWTWDLIEKSASSGNNEETFVQSSNSLALTATQSASTVTATLSGSLITVDFGVDLASPNDLSPTDFNVATTAVIGPSQIIPVFNVIAGSTASSVILQLEQSIPLSYNTTYDSSGNPTSSNNTITLGYTNNGNTEDNNGNLVDNFSNLNVTVATPNALSYVYKPVSGNGQNYTSPSLFLDFAETLDTSQTPDVSLFKVQGGEYTISTVQVLADGVVLVLDGSTDTDLNTDLQNVQISYTGGSSTSSGQAPQQLIFASGDAVPSFTIQNGLAALASQSIVVITDNNPDRAVALSDSIADYSITIGSGTSFKPQSVTISGNQAILNLGSNAVGPEQIVSIVLSGSYNISSMVSGSVPPSVQTNSLIDTVEADLGQDSSPVLIPTTATNSAPMLVWVADSPLLLPIGGVVYESQGSTASSVYITFADAVGPSPSDLTQDQVTSLISQLTVTDSAGTDYAVSNISVSANTLILSIGSVSAGAEMSVSYSPLQGSDVNLYLANQATNSQLWVPAFAGLGLVNSVGESGAPTLISASVSVHDESSNQVVLIFDGAVSGGSGVSSADFTLMSNGQSFVIEESITVTNNTVTFNAQPPSSSSSLIGSGDIVTVSYTGTSLNASTFTNQPVTTSPNGINTILKYVFPSSPGSDPLIQNIPGAGGLNFNPVGVYSSSGNGATILVWTNADISDVSTNITPGSFYTVNDASGINESLNKSDLYYSIYTVTTAGKSPTWSQAAALTSQQGSESNIAIGANADGSVVAAWINYYNNTSTIYLSELTYNSPSSSSSTADSSSGTWTWSPPVVIYESANPDPLTELSIATLNGYPTIFWTETQPPSYSQLTLEASPLLYYRLAEVEYPKPGGTITLVNEGIYGAGGNGTYSSSPLPTLNQQGALEPTSGGNNATNQGDPNPAVLFNPASSASSAPIPLAGNSFSIEFWFNVPELPSGEITLVSVNSQFTISLVPTLNGLVATNNGVNLVATQDFYPDPKEWNYFIATYDDTTETLSLYVNGKLNSSVQQALIDLPDQITLTMGSVVNQDSVYLDEVAFYRQALAYSEMPDITNFDNLTPAQISSLLFNANPIGNKYQAQYITPLSAGPNTNYVSYTDSSFTSPSVINPTVKPIGTQLSDSNIPAWDVTSYTDASTNGSVYPNGILDIYLPLSLANQTTGNSITAITVSANNSASKQVSWSIGNVPSSGVSGYQLAVVQGNKLVNSIGSANNSTYTILGSALDLDIFIDPGNNVFAPNTTFTTTIYYGVGTPSTQTLLASDPTAEPTPVNSNQVTATSTVIEESNDSTLATIDSGFIINTNNANIGYTIVSGDFNNDNKADVAVGNRGYTSSSSSVNGSIQILFGGGSVLSNVETNPLTMTDLSGNPGGLLITGIADTGQMNGDFPFSMATGDVNGDGITDLVIGAPNVNNAQGEQQGAVYVIYGSTSLEGQTIDVTQMASTQGIVINAPNPSAFILQFSQDLNTSDVPDINTFSVLSASSPIAVNSMGFDGANRLVLFLDSSASINDLQITYAPPASGTGLTYTTGDVVSSFIATSSSSSDAPTIVVGRSLFGYAVAVGSFDGSLNGNNPIMDIAIGAPLTPTATGQGEVFVAFDGSSTPSLVYSSTNSGELAGYSVAVSSYQTGTTFTGSTTSDDLIIGAPGFQAVVTNNWKGLSGLPASANQTPSGQGDAYPSTSTVEVGAVYIYQSDGKSHSSDPSLSFTQFASYIGSNQPSSSGTANNTNFGSALSSSDLDGDKINDLSIASPGDADNNGIIYVLNGAADSHASGSAQSILNTANLAIIGGLPFSQTGAIITSAGDLNDDRYDDFLITAPNGANGTGQSYVLFGPLTLDEIGESLDLSVTATDSQTALLLNGSLPYQLAGSAASSVGDINGDNVSDLMISAPNAGQLYAVYGHPWLADDGSLKLANISGDNGFVTDGSLYSARGVTFSGIGSQVVMLGDVNGDGFADVLTSGAANAGIGAILTFGASTKNLLDAAAGTDELIFYTADSPETITSVISAGDFNGDGFADIGFVTQSQDEEYFYLVLGNASLGSQTTLALGSSVGFSFLNVQAAEAVGDFNGDGFDDLLLTRTINGEISPYLVYGNSEGSVSNGEYLQDNGNNVFSGLGDINGYGINDLVGGNPGNNGSVTVYFGDSNGTIIPLSPPAADIQALPLNLDSSGWTFTSYTDPQQLTKYNGSPAFAEYNNNLYIAYTGVTNSSSNGSPYIQRSSDGSTWIGNPLNFESSLGQSSTGISMAVFKDQLYVAYLNLGPNLIVNVAEDSQTEPLIQFSSTPVLQGTKASYVSPAMVVFNESLYVFYATGGEYESSFGYYYSSDGVHWNQVDNIPGIPSGFLPLGASFAVTADDNNLYLSYATGNGGKTATGLTVAALNASSGEWWSNSFGTDPMPLRGTGLLNLGNTFYNFFLPNSDSVDVITTTTPLGPWGKAEPLGILEPSGGTNWYSYPNPTLIFDRVYIGIGIQDAGPDGNTQVYVSYVNTDDPVYQPNTSQEFGSQLQGIGDFNGDGISDFAILAPGYISNFGIIANQAYQNNQGAVLIYYGSIDGLSSISDPDLVLVAPAPTEATNIANNQVLNFSEMAAAGDVNGDGFDDLLVSSPITASVSDKTTDGSVFVVFGGGDSLYGSNYPTTSPFNLGNLLPVTNQISLFFLNPLIESIVPSVSSFTLQSNFTNIGINSLTFDDPYTLTLNLSTNIDITDFMSITYNQPTSTGSSALTYASNVPVKTFTSSSDSALSTSGAPIIQSQSYANYGFVVQGLPNSLAGISLDGGGDVNGDGFNDFLIGAPGGKGDDLNLAYTLFGSDFTQTVSQTGTIGNDVMVGSPTGESFVAGQGNDVIYTGGGVDVVYAGPGDDYVSVNDTYFRRLDGGAGLDVLALQGSNNQDWDLTSLSPGSRLRNFEIIVTENYGANTLTLNAASVHQLSSTNTLTIFLDSNDTLALSDDFSLGNPVYQYNRKFLQYTSNLGPSAASVLVNQAGKAITLTGSNRNTPAPILPSTTDTDTDGSLTAASQSMGTEDDVTLLSTSAVEMLINPSEASQSSSITPTKISVSNPTVSERSGRANFVVSRSGDLNKYTWVDYYTQDGDAKAGDRYTPLAGQLVFAPGESSKTVTVLIPNNGKYVGTRQFGLVAQLEGESTDANLVPDAWQAAIATPSEQVRKWKLVPGEDGNGSVTMNVTSTKSADHIITLDLDLDGTVIPQVWNRNTNSYQNIPFNSTNGIIEVQDINGDMISDLYRIRFQDGGVFDGDGLNNGLVALNFEFAQLKDVAVPLGGGRIEGAEDNNYINAQNSTGTNRLEGQGGMDVLIGSPQRDVLLGGDGNDIIMGGGNIDQLYGGAGDDLLDGGLGINFLYGGVGSDSFVLRQGDGPHRVMDFNSAEGDFFLLENLSLSQLGFSSNQITLGNNTLATVVDALGKPVTNFAANPSWFSTVLN